MTLRVMCTQAAIIKRATLLGLALEACRVECNLNQQQYDDLCRFIDARIAAPHQREMAV